MAKRGRPVGSGKISDEAIDKICDGIVRGLTIKGAASEAGIIPNTLYVWLDKAKTSQRGIYKDFKDRYEAAQARAKNLLENKLTSLAMGREVKIKKEHYDSKTGQIITLTETRHEISESAIKFILERRHAEEWGRKDKIDVTSKGKGLNGTIFGAVMGSGGQEQEDNE